MNDGLNDLLFKLRQHPSFQDFLRAVERPRMPRFKKYSKAALEDMGAQTVFVSGQLDQHDRWHVFLTGESPTGDDELRKQE